MDKQINNIDFFVEKHCFLSRNLFILVNIPLDLENLFLMYVIWSDQFNLLSINNPENWYC